MSDSTYSYSRVFADYATHSTHTHGFSRSMLLTLLILMSFHGPCLLTYSYSRGSESSLTHTHSYSLTSREFSNPANEVQDWCQANGGSTNECTILYPTFFTAILGTFLNDTAQAQCAELTYCQNTYASDSACEAFNYNNLSTLF